MIILGVVIYWTLRPWYIWRCGNFTEFYFVTHDWFS